MKIKYKCSACDNEAVFDVPKDTTITMWKCKCGNVNATL